MHFSLKRGLDGGGGGGHDIRGYELPPWTVLLVLANLLLLVPLMLIFEYTLKLIYPVFAMIEDENPPAYEPLSLSDPSAGAAERGPVTRGGGQPPRTVTSSFRAINRLLLANGGVSANFRGFFCFLAQVLLTSVLVGVFTGALGGLFVPVATLLAALALVQLSTAWVHVVISEPSPLPFWARLPPFRRTFDATWQAVTIFWFASHVARFIPLALALAMGLRLPRSGFGEPMDVDALGAGFFVKTLVLAVVTIACSVFVTVPAYVVLVRVQASLLPVDQSTIIPFDRSFQAKVEPEVVGGKGYATVMDAWTTYSKTAWRRLITLYLKMFAITMTALVVFTALLVPQIIFVAKHSKEVL
ncbi:uncharacterized protein UV8b_04452 [Ustilaginoidea virens]|uniref:Uncharacterized protein n=1 Tax=Ustilaginoidea virens TaxID=1159556 RepID=A0A063BW43_USTVR|nr:uncharacterized protein UV8b_04452 [Ustilaginoidea virens]QUC20211.1 hypothetical protein UV8b_04452 [Ustilaginoidea virens]GAO16004.1 hypothetical protein UVI_02055830 [Ustilaginoidea virens]